MSSAKERRHFTGQEKVAILRRHLVDKVAVSDLCEEHRINPTLFYRWQKDLFEQGAVVFDAPKGRARNGRLEDAAAKRITALTDKLRRKDEVLSELMEEHVALKKVLGKPERDLGSARHAGHDRRFRPALVGARRVGTCRARRLDA